MRLRRTQRVAYCRGCDRKILPNTEYVVYTYSSRNRGQNIFFCKECIHKMYGGVTSGEICRSCLNYYKDKHRCTLKNTHKYPDCLACGSFEIPEVEDGPWADGWSERACDVE